MRKFVLFVFVACVFQSGICQNKKDQEVVIVRHTVQLGETVRMISRKYLVDPSEIYKLNKFAVDGISQGQVLQIPVPKKAPVVQQEEPMTESSPEVQQQTESRDIEADAPKPKSVAKAKSAKEKAVASETVTVIDHDSQTEHTVKPGETLYSLSRQYNISVDEIRMSNGDTFKNGLKVGQVIKIPSTKNLGEGESSIGTAVTPSKEVAPVTSEPATTKSEASVSSEAVTHKVAPKETLYSLAKKYNVTAEDIKSQNPEVAKHGLQVGQILTIQNK